MSQTLFEDESLAGEVLGMVYRDETTGFGVIELEVERGSAPGTEEVGGARCAGPLADLVEGQHVKVVGRWTDHARHGRTFETVYYEQVVPSTEEGIRTFLRSDRFEAVRPAAIQRVLTAFGQRAGDVIEREPERLTGEAKLEQDDADELCRAWAEGASFARLHQLLARAGVKPDVIRAAHAHFGSQAVEVVTEDPFALLDVERAGFAPADALAQQVGVEPTDPRRLRAGALSAVRSRRRRDGHQVLRRADVVEAAARMLGVDAVLAAEGVDGAVAAGLLAADEVALAEEPNELVPVVTTPAALRAERTLAAELHRIATATSRLAAVTPTFPDELTTGQRTGIEMALEHPVSVLTGGPGTGKTRAIQELVEAALDGGANIALCAPTGRAARRVEQLVGHPATTVHRLLEARPMPSGGFVFTYGADERLPHDLVVCDEVSMCDTALSRTLVQAIDDGAHLVLVGDPDQLPSVGPGDVLRDLLRSGVVPATTLTEIHRQAADSRIVALARAINEGEVPPLPGADADVFMAEETRRAVIVPRVVEAVATRAPAYFDVEPDQVQVVAPVYRGPCGVNAMNNALKERLNPDTGQLSLHGLQEGDRVMQTRNDAELDVSNGDVGTIVDVSRRSLPYIPYILTNIFPGLDSGISARPSPLSRMLECSKASCHDASSIYINPSIPIPKEMNTTSIEMLK